ncbi:MAG TPA: hypothetical protein ENH82_19560 [bacterium]|nr:hypothetical protein [bacterium]
MAGAYTSDENFKNGFNAAVDMSAAQYSLIRINSGKNGEVSICSVVAEDCDGVLLNKPNSGEEATIAFGGLTPFRAGAAINAGDQVITSATGWGTSSVISGSTGKCLLTVTSGAVSTMIKYLGHHPQQA